MASTEYYRLNSPPVVLETVDEETIIVHLETGSYYDLNHSGGRVLHALDAGSDLEGAVTAVAGHYAVDRDLIADPAGALVDELVREGILVSVDEPGPAVLAPQNGAAARRYEAPALAKFTDMQELLLLDPVHEVDEAGWPNRL